MTDIPIFFHKQNTTSPFENLKIDESESANKLRERIITALRQVMDPELHVNVYDLKLIYDICIYENKAVFITMSLTSPNCPIAQTFPSMIQDEVLKVSGVIAVKVELTWDPPWSPDMLEEHIRLELGLL